MSVANPAARLPLVELGSLTALAAGGLALTGWLLGIELLKSIVPGTVAMKLNTAIAFVAVGAALVAASRTRNLADPAMGRLADVLSVGVVVLASLVLVQYPANVSLGVDQLLIAEPPGATATVHPGRMSPQTAMAFILIGSSLPAARRRRFPLAVLACAVVPAILGGLNLLDVLLDAATPTFLAAYTQMAVPSAVAFIALGLALVDLGHASHLMRVIRSGGDAASLAKRLLAATLVIPVVVAWLRLTGERAGFYDTAFGVSLATLAMIVLFVAVISQSTRALYRSEQERSALQRARAAGEERLQAIVDFAPALVIVSDLRGRFQLVNRRFAELVGREPADLVGLTPRDVLPAEAAARFDAERRRVVDTGGRIETERPISVGKDDDVHLVVHYPLLDSEGRMYAICGMASDVTRLKRAEAEAEGARRLAEEAQSVAEDANTAKTEFLSRMSHELRTPLNAVLGFAQLLELGNLEAAQRDQVIYIRKAGKQLLDLINEVLDISRIEAGALPLSPEAVCVSELIAEQLALIAPDARERNVVIEPYEAALGGDPSGHDDVHARHVLADRQRLRQVLLNLLSNAVKYNRPEGRVSVRSRARGDRVLIEVTDTGAGIPPAKMERLFVPFDRLGAERTDVEGTGIGLVLTRRLVEHMGGTLDVTSVEGEGSTFTLELPRAMEPISPLLGERRLADPAALAGDDGRDGRVVLAIEDNPINVRLLQQILIRRPGVRLLAASDAEVGLLLARAELPSLILLDLHLPGMSGAQVLASLKADQATRHIPVAILSADATRGQRERVLEAGAMEYLTKPLDVVRLLELVDASPPDGPADSATLAGTT